MKKFFLALVALAMVPALYAADDTSYRNVCDSLSLGEQPVIELVPAYIEESNWYGNPHTWVKDSSNFRRHESYQTLSMNYSKNATMQIPVSITASCHEMQGTEVGFANGLTDKPTYEQVYTDTTGYAETVHVTYDSDKVSLEFLLRMFFVAIDPTSLNKQGHDEGTRYRTGIYYTDAVDLPIIEHVYAEEQSKCAQTLVVEKLPLQNFYPADEYHQDYLDKHPDGYCHLPKALFDFARKAKDNQNN